MTTTSQISGVKNNNQAPQSRRMAMGGTGPKRLSPKAGQPASNPTAEQLKIQQSQLNIQAAPAFSKDEKAFMVLFEVSEKDFLELKRICGLEGKDDVTTITQKILASKDASVAVIKVKSAINKFREYQSYKDAIPPYSNPKFIIVRNRILTRAFKETLRINKDSPQLTDYFAIILKYGITDPLSVTRAALNKMSIFEETIFTDTTAQLLAAAISNLSFDEMQQFLALQEKASDEYDKYTTRFIAQNRKDLIPLRQKELKAQEALKVTPEDPKPALTLLTANARTIIKKYQQALAQLAAALKTTDPEDDKAVKAKLEAILKELITEIENEYRNAFVDTPTEPEKQAFKELIKATAELAIIDKTIIYYARLENSQLSDRERSEIHNLRGKGFSRSELDIKLALSISADKIIETYNAQAQPILKTFVAALRHDFAKSVKAGSFLGLGRSRSDALFFALLSAGFSEGELLIIKAAVGYELLNEEAKRSLSGTTEDKINACLKKMKTLNDFIKTENYKLLSAPEQEKIRAEFLSIYMIYEGLMGSSIKADYLFRIMVQGVKFGSLLESQFNLAESTPEEHDDLQMRRKLSGYTHFGLERFGIDYFSIIHTHLYARGVSGEPVDEDFIFAMLKSTSLFQMDGRSGLHSFKNDLVRCFSFYSLEFNAKDKVNFNACRNKLLSWLKAFIEKIRADVRENPDYSGSMEMSNKIAIIGEIYNLMIGAKIFTEDELARFFKANPIISAQANINIRNLRRGSVSRTIGYKNIPADVRKALKSTPSSQAVRQNSSFLNIYWVPQEKSNNLFSGYATHDRDTIAVVYSDLDGTMRSAESLAGTTVHELRHKINNQELKFYIDKNPDHKLPFRKVPSLITERNAYLDELNFLEALPKKTKEVQKEIKDLREIVSKSNILLGLSENSRDLLHPPFAGIDFNSPALDLHPGKSRFSLKTIKNISRIIGSLNYFPAEQKFLLDLCFAISAGEKFDLSDISPGRRNLFVDFLGKILGRPDLISNGIAAPKLKGSFARLKAEIKDQSEHTVISAELLFVLLFRRKDVQRLL